MGEHRKMEQSDLTAQAKQWEAAEYVCGVAAVALLTMSVVLSNYLSPRLGIEARMLQLAFTLLPLVWVGVMAYCSMRAKKLANSGKA